MTMQLPRAKARAKGGLRAIAAGLIALVLLAVGARRPALAEEAVLSKAERQAVEEAVRTYLREQPEVLIEAIRILQKRQQEAATSEVGNVIAARGDELFNDPETPVGGNPNGDVTLVEFFDYRCGYCKRVFPTVEKLIKEDGNIRFVYKEFPILGPPSVFAARAALASREQGKYSEFHDALMKARGRLSEERVLQIAQSIGLDKSALLRALNRNEAEYDRLIARNMDLARALRINGTPAFIAGDVVVRGAADYDSMKAVIAQARGARSGSEKSQ